VTPEGTLAAKIGGLVSLRAAPVIHRQTAYGLEQPAAVRSVGAAAGCPLPVDYRDGSAGGLADDQRARAAQRGFPAAPGEIPIPTHRSASRGALRRSEASLSLDSLCRSPSGHRARPRFRQSRA